MAEPVRLTPGHPGWPSRFAHLGENAAPRALFVLGALPPAGTPCVAVVGSRQPTPAGLLNARDLGFELGAAGVTVISGLARGVDSAAHLGALDAAGVTVAVLGCGIEHCYPPENRRLRERIVDGGGAVISEDPGDAPPERWRFPRRNRLIAALCEAVVVVEASAKSGALSTASRAGDLGREVLAVPGSIRTSAARGTNALIRDGVRPYLGIGDLFDAVPALARGMSAPRVALGEPPGVEPDPVLRRILDAVADVPLHPDDLAVSLRLSAREVSTAVTTLSLRGAVTEVSGGRLARTF